MSARSLSTAVRPNDRQFVSDLANLFRRHKVRCGDPGDLEHLSSELETNGRLCQDLFLLCTAISHMSEADLSPDELLDLIARAVGGPRAFTDGAAEVSPETRAAFVDRYSAWLGRTTQGDGIRGMDSDQDEVSWRGSETPFSRAAALSRKPETQEVTKQSGSHGTVSPETAIGDLTLRELSQYLIDLESRVKRAEAHLTPAAAALAAASAARHAAAETPLAEQELQGDPNREGSPDRLDLHTDSNPQEIWPEPAQEQHLVDAELQQVELDDALIDEMEPDEARLDTAQLAHTDPTDAEEPTPTLDEMRSSKRPFAGVAWRLDPPLEAVGAAPAYGIVSELREPRIAPQRTYEGRGGSRKTRTISYPTAAVFALALLGGAALGYRFMVAPATSSASPKASADQGSERQSPDGAPVADVPSATGPAMQLPGFAAKPDARASLANPPGGQAARPNPAKLFAGTGVEMQPTATPATDLLAASASPVARVPQPVISEIVPAQIPKGAGESPGGTSRQVIEPFTQRTNAAGVVEGSSRGTADTGGGLARADFPRSPATSGPAPASRPNVVVVSVPSSTLMRNALSIPGPKYPLGRRIVSDSSVVVRATISKDGRVISATPVSGADDLRVSAQNAILQWRFRPYLVDGNPAEVVTAVTFMFKAR